MFWEHGDWLDIDASEIGRVLAVLRESMQEHEAAAFVEDATTAPAPGQVRVARARAPGGALRRAMEVRTQCAAFRRGGETLRVAAGLPSRLAGPSHRSRA